MVALAAIALQFIEEWRQMGAGATTAAVLWTMARYFTILTNALVAGVLGYAAMTGRWPGAGWPAGTTVWIIAVGVVYHALLAATHNPQGLEVWSNILFHSVVPLGTAALWLTAAPKAGLTFLAPVVWTFYPLAYALYALLRGLSDGTFPYFFLDPEKSGALGVAAYILGLGAFFLAVGCMLVGITRLTDRRTQPEAAS